MTTFTTSKFGCFLAGACIAAAGFFLGTAQSPALHAQPAQAPAQPAANAEHTGISFGVSIPNGGAAVVKGRDGYAYIVDSRGLYVRASQSGKALELP